MGTDYQPIHLALVLQLLIAAPSHRADLLNTYSPETLARMSLLVYDCLGLGDDAILSSSEHALHCLAATIQAMLISKLSTTGEPF